MKPAASRRCFTSRKGNGLSRPNFYLDHLHPRQAGCLRFFEVEFESFSQISERFLFSFALAGDVDFQALGDEPLSFAPGGGCEWLLHRFNFDISTLVQSAGVVAPEWAR